MTTWSECSHSAMRPEYLAEFLEAGVPPGSAAELRDQIETDRDVVPNVQPGRTRKVIISQPARSADGLEAGSFAAIVVGLILVLVVATFLPLVVLAMLGAVAGGGRRRRRRRW